MSAILSVLFISFSIILLPRPGYCDAGEKIGVVFLGFGMEEEYKIDWLIGYQHHLYPIFPPGMMAGGHLEGGDCYTLIHYANAVEAEICSEVSGNNISEGTPIDTFCNEYTNTAEHPIHSMADHSLFGTDGYLNYCSRDLLSFFMALGHSTIDPVTGKEIIGPHVDDPDGSGIGISDFEEMAGFLHMEYHHTLEDHKSPYRRQILRWTYGNDIPSHYGYTPDETEKTNIRDELERALAGTGTTVAVRVAWITYMENKDLYGNELFIPDSVESVLTELVEEEQVDRIIVMGSSGHFANITAWGYCWNTEDDTGISRVKDKTYYECINDLDDSYGPDKAENLETLLTDKPWKQHASPNPMVYNLAQNIAPETPLAFTNAFGDYNEFNGAVLEHLKHSVSKYQIDNNTKLKVIVTVHGYAGGYLKSAECDSYFVKSEALAERCAEDLDDYLAANWAGTFEVVFAPNEFAQPSFEGTTDDTPTRNKPMGNIVGTGEHIDMAINGKYVNELGQLIDNGEDNFDYVIVLPIGWDGENVDTIQHFRHETLGNHALQEAQGQKKWLRLGESEDGDEYNSEDDYDSEYYTIKVMDGTGWLSPPQPTWLSLWPKPVGKGSADNPTTVILAGAFLSLADGPVRTNLTDAAVASILESIENPLAGGYHDTECEIKALNDIISFTTTAGCSAVELSWSTMSEVESHGFHILQSESETGTYQKITDTLIASTGDISSGGTYTYIDKNLKNRQTYYYKIEHIFGNSSAMYGPVSVTPLLINLFNLL